MKAYINVSAALIYRNPTFHSEADTQAVLGEPVRILSRKNDFIQIRCEDGYEGWLNRFQLCEQPELENLPKKIITSELLKFYDQPDSNASVLRDGTAGGYVYLLEQTDSWQQVLLPDGVKAWIEKINTEPLPPLSRANLLNYAKRFMGVPYLWAGKTPKGFDCSGLMQLVHKMFGIVLRRDAWMQYEDARQVADNPLDGQPGDMMFFTESSDKITHVGFCLGAGKLLHARGLVRINSLQPGDPLFSAELSGNFAGIRSYF